MRKLWCITMVFVLGFAVTGCSSNESTDGSGTDQRQNVAQTKPADQEPRQINFPEGVNLQWGSDTSTVIDHYGEPDEKGHPRDDGSVIAYRYQNESFQGYPASRIVYFGRNDGLILFAVKAPFNVNRDCEAIFEDMRSLINEANPSIKPETYRENESNRPFCKAASDGDARWELGWLLPDSSSMAALSISPGGDEVEMALTSSAYGKYMKRSGRGH